MFMMRGIKKGFLFIAVFLTAGLHALDITVIGGVGNMSFDTASENPLGSGEFKGNFYPLVRLTVSDQISDSIGCSATLERDPVLRNTLSCDMIIESGFLKLSVGPLFGLFSTWQTPVKPGISAGICFEFPGIIFIDLKGGASFGTIREKGDYTMELSRIALGFWLPNLVNTISITNHRFTMAKTSSLTTEDELFRVCNRIDIYAKNIPYTISIDMGYQSLKRSYDGTANGEDLIRAVFLGFETAITIKPSFIFHLGAEVPVYIWGKEPLTRADKHWCFQAFTGFTIVINKDPN